MKNDKENLNQPINEDRRKLLGLAGVASAGALLSPLLSKAAPTTIIEAGSGVDTASYIIFKDGNTIYAKNGMTGKIEFQGSDAATVINNCITALPSAGGLIHLKRGIYTISAPITILPKKDQFSANTIIQGEGYGTNLQLAAGATTDVINMGAEHISRFTIRDFHIDGNKIAAPLGGMGINIGTSAWDVLIDHLLITNCHNYGIYQNGGTTLRLRDIYTYYCDEASIYVKGTNFSLENLIFERVADDKWAAIIGTDGGT